MPSYVPVSVNQHYVLRRMTMDDVKNETSDHRMPAVVYAFKMDELNSRVRTYFPHWQWNARSQSLFGGYWTDPTLTGDREGECYLITTAQASDDLVKVVWTAYHWHGSDALYGFASRGGIILGEEDRSELCNLVAKLKEQQKAGEDVHKLTDLLNWITYVPVIGRKP